MPSDPRHGPIGHVGSLCHASLYGSARLQPTPLTALRSRRDGSSASAHSGDLRLGKDEELAQEVATERVPTELRSVPSTAVADEASQLVDRRDINGQASARTG